MSEGASIQCRSYAKINLYLDVLQRRDDGFHNLETLFQSVSLFDELTVTVSNDGSLELSCSREDLENERNLAYQAAVLLREETGTRLGAHIEVTKRIPVAAGLAGGSGNAAAVLLALNDLWGLALSRDQLLAYALALGSDVPFCMLGGTVAATGRGEVMQPLEPLTSCAFVLVHPAVEVNTAKAFAHPRLERQPEPRGHHSESFSRAITQLERGRAKAALFNRMEPPVFGDHPELAALKERLLAAGCEGAVMSGSGPTMVGLCASREEAAAIAARITDCATSFAVPTSGGVAYV